MYMLSLSLSLSMFSMTLANNLMRLPISALRVFGSSSEAGVLNYQLIALIKRFGTARMVVGFGSVGFGLTYAYDPQMIRKHTQSTIQVNGTIANRRRLLVLVTRAQSRCGSGWKAGEAQERMRERWGGREMCENADHNVLWLRKMPWMNQRQETTGER